MWYHERNDATSTTVPGGIIRRRKAAAMPINPGVTLEVKAALDLPSAYELAEEIRALIKDAIVKGVRDALREAAEFVDRKELR